MRQIWLFRLKNGKKNDIIIVIKRIRETDMNEKQKNRKFLTYLIIAIVAIIALIFLAKT